MNKNAGNLTHPVSPFEFGIKAPLYNNPSGIYGDVSASWSDQEMASCLGEIPLVDKGHKGSVVSQERELFQMELRAMSPSHLYSCPNISTDMVRMALPQCQTISASVTECPWSRDSGLASLSDSPTLQ